MLNGMEVSCPCGNFFSCVCAQATFDPHGSSICSFFARDSFDSLKVALRCLYLNYFWKLLPLLSRGGVVGEYPNFLVSTQLSKQASRKAWNHQPSRLPRTLFVLMSPYILDTIPPVILTEVIYRSDIVERLCLRLVHMPSSSVKGCVSAL